MVRITYNEKETYDFAKEFAKTLQGGDIVCFFGPMGVGKTAFMRGLCAHFNCEDQVSSPTFTIVKEYNGTNKIYHFDMYRITDENSFYNLGFDDYLDNESIVCIEWSENVFSYLPKDTICVKMEYAGGDTRKITVFEKGEYTC